MAVSDRRTSATSTATTICAPWPPRSSMRGPASAAYGTKARAGVMAGIASLTVGCGQAILSIGRQLTAYVLAADFAGLSGTADTTFRAWLTTIRTRDVGGHAVWRSLSGPQADSANNWGAYAGASRIAASLYLGDTHDVTSPPTSRVGSWATGPPMRASGRTSTVTTCHGVRARRRPTRRSTRRAARVGSMSMVA